MGWTPVLDLCCDPLGGNSLCPFYYDAICNALKQLWYLYKKRIIANPPYHMCDEFIELLQRAFEGDLDTRILLVIPKRPSR